MEGRGYRNISILSCERWVGAPIRSKALIEFISWKLLEEPGSSEQLATESLSSNDLFILYFFCFDGYSRPSPLLPDNPAP